MCHIQVTCNKPLQPHPVQALSLLCIYGRLDVSTAKSYGLAPGPLLGQLKVWMAVTVPDVTEVSDWSSSVHMATSGS